MGESGDSQEQKATDKQKKQAKDTPSPTPEGPEEYAFVKKYVEEAIYPARKSGDTSKVLSMGTDDCHGCQNMADHYKEVYANGGGYKGDPLEQVIELTQEPKGSDPVVLRVKTKMNEVKFIEAEGVPPMTQGGREDYYEFALAKEGGEWKVANFCRRPPGAPSGCPKSDPS